jgi:toxin YoeB
MKLVFTDSSWDDYLWFQENDRKLLKRINVLIKETKRTPFDGIGKPEPLTNRNRPWHGSRVTYINPTLKRFKRMVTITLHDIDPALKAETIAVMKQHGLTASVAISALYLERTGSHSDLF